VSLVVNRPPEPLPHIRCSCPWTRSRVQPSLSKHVSSEKGHVSPGLNFPAPAVDIQITLQWETFSRHSCLKLIRRWTTRQHPHRPVVPAPVLNHPAQHNHWELQTPLMVLLCDLPADSGVW